MRRAGRPSAQTTGSMKRRVEPDSPQSRVGTSVGASAPPAGAPWGMGLTRKPALVRAMRAPRASRHAMVASMSLEVVAQSMSQVASASAAMISRRCAADFDAMASMVPERGLGSMM